MKHRKTATVVTRFTVSLDEQLLHELDRMIGQKGYTNRSQAVADMIRADLVDHRQQFGDQEIAGTITLIYDHHRPHVMEVLTDIQHDHGATIISTLHVHLDHHNCLEVLVLRGKAHVIKSVADQLISTKGVKHGKLTVTTAGRDFPR